VNHSIDGDMTRGIETLAGSVPFARRPGAVVTDFLTLTKPRIVLMVLVTTTAGFLLGAAGNPDWLLLGHLLFAGALAAGGTLALNQYLERDTDGRMRRTQSRPLPGGRLAPTEALLFGTIVTMAGLLYLMVAVSPLCSLLTVIVTVTYLFVYTPLKRLSPVSSFVGAIPGALPAVTGWAAATGEISAASWVLFLVMFFWQIPHNMAIAWLCRHDYARAGVRVLPVIDPDGRSTANQSVLNGALLLAASLLPTIAGMTSWIYLIGATVLGAAFLTSSIQFKLGHSRQTARRVLFGSYAYLPLLFGMMALDSVL